MPEQSHRGPTNPGDSPNLLEPSGNDYELAVTTDLDVATMLAGNATDDETFVKKKLGIGFWIATGWFSLITILMLSAPLITATPTSGQDKTAPTISLVSFLQHPNLQTNRRTDPNGGVRRPPTSTHWLGTDSLGRDIFSRLIWGARVSLPVGFASIGLGLMIGVALGLLSGYMKGWVDTVLMSTMDVMLAFPALLLAMAIIGFRDQRDVPTISLAIGIVAVPAIARLVRASTLTYREREFVLASRTLGASHIRILVREILPNVVPPVLSFAVIGVAIAISAESALAFVGISVPIPTATWGGMILEGKDQLLLGNPQLVFIPCTLLVMTVMAFYFAGDRLRQFFDVKESML